MGAPLTLAIAPSYGSPTPPEESEPWVLASELPTSVIEASEALDLDSICKVASEILFLLSGRKYGTRTETVRPHAGNRGCGWQHFGSNFAYQQWLQHEAYDEGPDWLKLKSPVQTVLEVKVDGTVLNADEYAVYDNAKLVRMRSSAGFSERWPLYQRLDQLDTEVGTFSVNYQWGIQLPEGGKVAAKAFATQLAKYMNNDSDCALPDRVISVSRQGVTQTLMDPSQFVKEARTGLYVVDLWLGAVNPNGNRRRPSVLGPDSPELSRLTPDIPGGYGNDPYGA